MILLSFFQWWYGPGWVSQIKAISGRVSALADTFSIRILLRTLFSPWKQITTSSMTDQSMQIKMRAGVDNVISRLVGFSVRMLVLLVACISIVLSVLVSIAIAILWPIIPSLVLFVIPLGFTL